MPSKPRPSRGGGTLPAMPGQPGEVSAFARVTVGLVSPGHALLEPLTLGPSSGPIRPKLGHESEIGPGRPVLDPLLFHRALEELSEARNSLVADAKAAGASMVRRWPARGSLWS